MYIAVSFILCMLHADATVHVYIKPTLTFPALFYTALMYRRPLCRFNTLFSVTFQCYWHRDSKADIVSSFENIFRS
jgi:hypothetical protein